MRKPVGASRGNDSTSDKTATRFGDAEGNGSGRGKAGLVLHGFSFAEQISQRPLDKYLLDRFLIAHSSKGLCINQPPETQLVEKDDLLFFIHGQRSFDW